MTLQGVRTAVIRWRLLTPFVTALPLTDLPESVVVEVVDAVGRSGSGEATHGPPAGIRPDAPGVSVDGADPGLPGSGST
jgi:hypothetical protein